MPIRPAYLKFYCYSLLLVIFLLLLFKLPGFHESITLNKIISEGFAVSPDGMITESEGKFHLIAYEFNALPGTTYSIEIMPISIDFPINLIVDIYANNFDRPEQERAISISGQKYEPIVINLFSGEAPPKNLLRFMYSNESPVNFTFKITKISFQKKPYVFIEKILKMSFFIYMFLGIWCVFTSIPGKRFITTCRSTIELHAFCVIIIIYFLVSILRFITVSYMPFWSGDEYVYKTLANYYWLYGDFFKINTKQVSDYGTIPNLLYPYIVSSAFHFGDSFYAWLRLINCLLFSLSIIPVYILANNYVDKFKSIITATLTILIPWGNLTAYAVTEVLYFPCFLFCVLFLYYAMKSLHIGYVFALSISCSLLVHTRPAGYIITFIALILLIIYSIAIHKNKLISPLLILVIYSTGFILTFLFVNLLLQNKYLPGLGVYKKAVIDVNTNIIDVCLNHRFGVFKLVVGHIGIFGIIYILSISSSLTRIANAIRNLKSNTAINDPLLIITWTTFIVTLFATILFTIRVSETDLGGLERWHGRYYFFIFPLFFIEAVRAISEKTTAQYRKLMICVIIFLLSLNYYFYIFENALQFRWFGSLVDNMDAQWYKHFPWLYPYVLAVIGLSLFFLVRENTAFVAWVFGTILLLGIANVGTMVAARIFSADDLRCSKLIQGVLQPTDLNYTAIYAKDRAGIVNPLFWLTKDLALAVQTGQASTIKVSDIPNNIKFVITHDPVTLDFPVSKSMRCGECEVHILY